MVATAQRRRWEGGRSPNVTVTLGGNAPKEDEPASAGDWGKDWGTIHLAIILARRGGSCQEPARLSLGELACSSQHSRSGSSGLSVLPPSLVDLPVVLPVPIQLSSPPGHGRDLKGGGASRGLHGMLGRFDGPDRAGEWHCAPRLCAPLGLAGNGWDAACQSRSPPLRTMPPGESPGTPCRRGCKVHQSQLARKMMTLERLAASPDVGRRRLIPLSSTACLQMTSIVRFAIFRTSNAGRLVHVSASLCTKYCMLCTCVLEFEKNANARGKRVFCVTAMPTLTNKPLLLSFFLKQPPVACF